MPRSSRPLAPLAVALAALAAGAVARAEPRDYVTVAGSSTVFPFATAVAEALGRQGKSKTAVVEASGTGGGFKLFCSGAGIDTPDVNDASRRMTEAEKAGCARHGVGAIEEIRIGYDGIVLASSRASQAFDLTREQLYRAVAKTVPVGGRLVPNPYRRWSDLDPSLPGGPIAILGPAPNRGMRDAFVELVMEPSCAQSPEIHAMPSDAQRRLCQTIREDGAWIDAAGESGVLAAKLASDPGQVGLFTFAYLDHHRERIQAARIDGVAPTPGSIAGGSYPLSRPLYIYVKRAHLAMVPGLADFVAEFVSDAAAGVDGYLADKGLTPLPKTTLEGERAKARALAAPGH